MGILSSTCKRNSSRHPLSPSYRIRHKSLDKNFFLNNSNSTNNKNDTTFPRYTQLTANTRENSTYSLLNKSLEKPEKAPNKTVSAIKVKKNTSTRNLAGSSTIHSKRSKKSRSLSALDQIHIIITNIDVPNKNQHRKISYKKICQAEIFAISENPKFDTTKRRSRRFSQIKTRKSYNFETKPNALELSSQRVDQSQSSLSNASLIKSATSPIKKHTSTEHSNTARVKKSATAYIKRDSTSSTSSAFFTHNYFNNTNNIQPISDDLRLRRLENLKLDSYTNMSHRKHHTHEHHHYHHSNSSIKAARGEKTIIDSNSKNHVKAEYFNDEICSSSSISISSQVNGGIVNRRFSNKNGRNVFNNLYNQGI